MSKQRGRKSKPAGESSTAPVVDRASPWSVVYYRAADGTVPALGSVDSCPGKIEAEFVAVLDAVTAAPPPQFSGGGNPSRDIVKCHSTFPPAVCGPVSVIERLLVAVVAHHHLERPFTGDRLIDPR